MNMKILHLQGVHFSGMPDEILGGQSSFTCLPHQLSAANSTTELTRSMMRPAEANRPVMPLKMAKGFLTNQGIGLAGKIQGLTQILTEESEKSFFFPTALKSHIWQGDVTH